MKTNILGYLVLRTPEFNFDELGRGAYLPYAPKINDLNYSGIDRMQWFDVEEDYYNKSLPTDVAAIWQTILNTASSTRDLKLCKSIKDAEVLLDYSNKTKHCNELVAIYIDDITGLQPFESDICQSIGYDLYCDGYGSMLREGVFSKPELFLNYIPELNKFGLFNSNIGNIDKYINEYIELSKKNSIEKFIGRIQKVALFIVA